MKVPYAKFDADGNIVGSGIVSEESLPLQKLSDGMAGIMQIGAEAYAAIIIARQSRLPMPYKVDVTASPVVLVAVVQTDEEITAAAFVDAKNAVAQACDGQFKARLSAGYTFGGVRYQIDDASRANMTGAAVIASLALSGSGAWPEGGYPWIAADNSIHLFAAPADFIAFGQAVAAYYAALVLNARGLKNSISSLTDTAACAAFDVTQGWP
jgi:hypothetical protein